jgi:hypothetical protein
MNDPLLQEIRLAYQTQNLVPIRRFFSLHEGGVDYVCPLVALAIHRGQVDRTEPEIEIDGGANTALEVAAKTFGEDWTIGFLDGFDGMKMTKDSPDYLAGHELGVEAAQQLSPCDPPL